MHAHHIFPHKFSKQFLKAGIDVNLPIFGAWWEGASHLKNASGYNKAWETFLETAPNTQQILEFGKDIMKKYGMKVNF